MKTWTTSGLVAALLSVCVALPVQAQGQRQSGQQLSSACAACHGPQGLSTLPNAPHLAGQPVAYLVEQLRLYRSGKRHNEIMNLMAKPLTDQQIEDLAAWYGAIPIQIVPAPSS